MKKNNNFYALDDFVATVLHCPIGKDKMKKVLWAWGHTNGSSKENSGSELLFGAIVELKDGKVLYICGWNDYTGWGCQDNVRLYFDSSWFVSQAGNFSEFMKKEIIKNFEKIDKYFDFDTVEWEKEPVDLNRWLNGEVQVDETYLI